MFGQGPYNPSAAAPNIDTLIAQIKFYQDVHRLKTDVLRLLQVQRNLRPKVETFQGQDADQRVTLFFLHGTIPIVYGGNTYNIPMTIYFDPPYPSQPPRCFVSPTEGMQIKPRHKHVDAKGMIYLPYLNQWKPQTSTCLDLVAQISQVFSLDPPVYSSPGTRPQNQQLHGHTQTPQEQVLAGKVVGGSGDGRKVALINILTTRAHDRIPVLLQPTIDNINKQLEVQESLVSHKAEVESIITGLEAESGKIDWFNQELIDAESKATALFAQHKENEQEDFDVIAFLEPNCPLSRQLLDLVSEDLAYDDLLVFLEDNLQSRCIEPERFLELVRDTSRKIFYCKELKKKVIGTIRAGQMPNVR